MSNNTCAGAPGRLSICTFDLPFLALLCLLTVNIPAFGAAPRVLVQPPQGVIKQTDLREPGTRVNQCLSIYLYEWFATPDSGAGTPLTRNAAAPAVRLVDEGQAASVLGSLNSPAWVPRGADLYTAVNAAVAIDALITWRWADGKLSLDLQRPGGVKRLETPWTDAASIPKALKAVTDFLAAELGLQDLSETQLEPGRPRPGKKDRDEGVPAPALKMEGERPREPGQLIEDVYLMRRYSAEWVDNSGEKQLDVLRPYLKRLPQDTWTAAAIVRSGTAMSTDNRGVTKPAVYIMLIQQALPCLLGTAQEPVAIEFMEHNRHLPGTLEKDLLAMIAAIGRDEVEALADATGPGDELGGAVKSMADGDGGVIGILSGPKTVEQQAGAIRCLGAMRSKMAVPHFERIAKTQEVRLRQAVAWALGRYASPTGDIILATLAGDSDTRTAFLAAYGLWQRGQKPRDLLRLASACLDLDPVCDEAVEVLAKEGDAAVVPKLRGYIESSGGASATGKSHAVSGAATSGAGTDVAAADKRWAPGEAGDKAQSHAVSGAATKTADGLRRIDRVQQRALAVQGLLRLGALNGQSLTAALTDPDAAVIRAALAGVSDKQLPRDRLVALANHPDPTLAESARQSLQALLPADPRERRRFELAVEHPYVRRQIIAALAKDGSPAALDDLTTACDNNDPQTRAYALGRLAEKAPERARPVALRLLQDPHRWVRLHAAALAARLATVGDTAAVKAALVDEKDDATRLYLDDALARAEGRPLPASRPAANLLRLDKTTVFLCGHGEDCVNSPVQGYYDLAYKPDEPARKAHAAGKLFLARANQTAKNPAQVFLNSGWRDGFWLGLDGEFGDLAALDGVVLGEESMYFKCWNEWNNGWRLFCREAGIAPDRVAGDKEKLTGPEKQAWWNWEQRVAIEGFNTMGAYIKLRFGKLRPGFQVCTFMPDQNGPGDFDREWNFDIGAGYYYETNNRNRYTQIRRYKTLWPDRPVIWLCDGTQTGLHVPLNYKYPALQQPLLSPHSPAYADALCAWLAGADPGYFYAQLALSKDIKPGLTASGTWLFLEDLYPGSSSLQRALTSMFRGVEELYRTGAEMKAVHEDMAAGRLEAGKDPDDDIMAKLDITDPEKDPFRMRAKSEESRLRWGLLLERKLAWDCVRLLADLPRPTQTNGVLLVGDMRAETGALRLPSSYDALDRLTALDGQDLSRYRVIAVAHGEAAALRNGTVTGLTDWLRNTPGLLYVRGWINTSNTAEAAVVGDLDGKLEAEWPWVKDVEYAGQRYRLTGGHAIAVEGEEAPAIVFWQGPGFKGGVVFDASDLEPGKLRDVMNRLCAQKGIGAAFTGPMGVEAAERVGLKAMASCKQGAVTNILIEGVDLPTGISDPVLGRERTGVFMGDGFTGTYAASWNGVSVLAERPLRAVKAVEGGLELTCDGLIQAVSVRGRVEARCDGQVPPPVATNNVLAWLLESTQPGWVTVEREDKSGAVTFVRARGTVRLTERATR